MRIENEMLSLITGLSGLCIGAIGAATYVWKQQSARRKAALSNQTAIITAASHTLSIHLNTILGQSQLLSSRSKQYRSEDRHLIRSVLGSSDELRRTLIDTVDIVGLITSDLELEEQDVDLDGVLREIIGLNNSKARRKGVQLTADYATKANTIYKLDPIRLRQCINSLIGQCVFQAKDSTIFVNVGTKKMKSGQHRLMITVTDPNIQLQKYQVDAYFSAKAFYRNQYLGKESSWRLSVLLSQQVAKHMGGYVTARSNAECGLEFNLSIPISFVRRDAIDEQNAATNDMIDCKESVPVCSTEAERAAHNPSACKILVADDDTTNLMILEALLRASGYHHITTVADGQQAFNALQKDNFDVLLTDYNMPKLSGVELTEAIRQSNLPCATLPIVVVSAAASQQTRKDMMERGVNAFIAKPILRDELCVVLKEQLDLSTTSPKEVVAQ